MELIELIQWVFRLLYFAILARIILSVVIPMLGANPNALLLQVYQGLGLVTEPILAPIRNLLNKVLPSALGMFDFSPIVAIILLQVVQSFVTRSLGQVL